MIPINTKHWERTSAPRTTSNRLAGLISRQVTHKPFPHKGKDCRWTCGNHLIHDWLCMIWRPYTLHNFFWCIWSCERYPHCFRQVAPMPSSSARTAKAKFVASRPSRQPKVPARLQGLPEGFSGALRIPKVITPSFLMLILFGRRSVLQTEKKNICEICWPCRILLNSARMRSNKAQFML